MTLPQHPLLPQVSIYEARLADSFIFRPWLGPSPGQRFKTLDTGYTPVYITDTVALTGKILHMLGPYFPVNELKTGK